jgi:membrane associated rhomboid family serine protease
MLAFIGPELEIAFGKKKLIFFFFTCTTTAGIIYLGIQIWGRGAEGLGMPLVGASAGIYGILLAYGLLYRERVLLFMMLFPMKAKYFIWILAGIEFMTSIYSGRSGVASVAHLGGMAAGFGFLVGLVKWRRFKEGAAGRRGQREDLQRRERVKRAGQHLKLVINQAESKGALGPSDDDADEKNSDPKTWH